MKLIGLCGRSGSGKSECGRMLAEMGFAVIDCDVVYHELIQKSSPLQNELTNFFGTEILDKDGSLNRKVLGKIVFADDKLLGKLNEITHKHILNDVLMRAEKAASESKGGLVVVQAPLLFESGFDRKCHKIVGVIAPENKSIERLNKRDSITKEQAETRLSKQLDNDFLIQNCDYIIYNDSDLTSLREKTEEVFGKILEGSLHIEEKA
jgi:dephospho-CoA kinase